MGRGRGSRNQKLRGRPRHLCTSKGTFFFFFDKTKPIGAFSGCIQISVTFSFSASPASQYPWQRQAPVFSLIFPSCKQGGGSWSWPCSTGDAPGADPRAQPSAEILNTHELKKNKPTNHEVIVPMNLPRSDKSGADQCCMAPAPIARLLDLLHGQGAPLQPMDVHPDL